MSSIELAEGALQKPAYTLKLFQDDITVSLGTVIVTRALATLEICVGKFNRRRE